MPSVEELQMYNSPNTNTHFQPSQRSTSVVSCSDTNRSVDRYL